MGANASAQAKDDGSTELRPQSPRLRTIIKGDIKEKYDIGAGDTAAHYLLRFQMTRQPQIMNDLSELGKGNTATVKRGVQKSSGKVFLLAGRRL